MFCCDLIKSVCVCVIFSFTMSDAFKEQKYQIIIIIIHCSVCYYASVMIFNNYPGVCSHLK